MGDALDLTNGNTADGTPIQQWAGSSGNPNQSDEHSVLYSSSSKVVQRCFQGTTCIRMVFHLMRVQERQTS